ncbi:MAG TPA: hypothetical protein VH478_24515 [Trebonia sp.]|nr:hypothetical protein [Trebonia sp.]
MNHDEREEIAASVAAHAELGPRYESAVAEGLIERIGEEIDKRVDARLRGGGQSRPATPSSPGPAPSPGPVPPLAPAPAAFPPPGSFAQPAAYGPPAPFGPPGHFYPPAPVTPPGPPHRSTGATIVGLFLGLGSMGLGTGATAVVVSHEHNGAAGLFMVLLIWLAITIVNVANARFYWAGGEPPWRRHHRDR